jgi:hypothetical protein
MATTVTGGCLCGAVRFEAALPFSDANYCHCSRCRKHSGSEFGVQARVPREQFRLLSGGELITVYRPEGGRVKAFCSICGSSLFGREWPEGEEIAIRLGTLDGDPGIRPGFHTFADSAPPWAPVSDDGLPRYAEGFTQPSERS